MLGSAGSNVGVATGGAIMSAAPLAGPSAPLVAAAGALVALASTIAGALHIGEGCGPTCIQATSVVNQAEPILKQNVAMFEAGQVDKATALSVFNQVWTAVQQGCGGIPGAAGQNCIGDRQRGGKWDWFSYYYDPIANGPDTVTTYGGTSVESGGDFLNSEIAGIPVWLIAGGLVLIAATAKGVH